jgi:hypothetical protein
MFNTYITKKEDRLVPYEKTVTEIKAPTDDSIKLLNEWKDKLMEQIVGVYRTENCAIDMVAAQSTDPSTRVTRLTVKTIINGVEKFYAYVITEETLLTRTVADILSDKVKEIVADNVTEITRNTLVKLIVERK